MSFLKGITFIIRKKLVRKNSHLKLRLPKVGSKIKELKGLNGLRGLEGLKLFSTLGLGGLKVLKALANYLV